MKDDRVYLWHIRDVIQRIFAYTVEGEEAFWSDTKTQDAVGRNLEVIGEATKNISDTLKGTYPEPPGRRLPICAISSYTSISE
jgi:uncharacterized protein with HEPN domain